MEIIFKLNGQQMRLSTQDVEQAVAETAPEPIRTHLVIINGQSYPPKQPFALATGLDRLDFTTNQARTQLRRLGYRVDRIGK